MNKLSICLMMFSFVANIYCEKIAGGNCTFVSDDGTKEDALCKVVFYCRSALELKKQKIKPQICSTEGTYEIVCCPLHSNLTGEKSTDYCERTHEKLKLYSAQGNPIANHGVAGGEDASPKEFPHMAALGFGDERNITWACGGSLISQNYVLTAAHCLKDRKLGPVQFVRLGDLNLKRTDDDAEPQDFRVLKTFPHPDYIYSMHYHDIGLIQLDRDVKVTDYVRPACLNVKAEIEYNNFVATGWGALEYGGKTADHLQKVEIDGFEKEKCRHLYRSVGKRRLPNGIVDEWQLCAGADKKDTCGGDSGGPLQQRNHNYFAALDIYGVTSFGVPCAESNTPGVYTRVSFYVPWIESIVWPN